MNELNISDYETTGEQSLYKGIPIVYRYHPVIRSLMKSRLFSVKYRGASKKSCTLSGYEGYGRPQNFCHKEGADSFAIYPYSNYEEYKDIRNQFAPDWDYIHDLLKVYAKDIITKYEEYAA